MFKKTKNKGFTLIEIMIAIAIIGALAAIAIPNYINYRKTSYCAAAEMDASAVVAAIADYFASPLHVNMPNIVDLNVAALSHGNTYQLESTDPDTLIIIKIETANTCPAKYQNQFLRPDATSVGWDGSGNYYMVIKK